MATLDNSLQELLTERDVARIVGLSVASIRRRRLLKQPPRFRKIGAAVRYQPSDVAAWIEAQPSGSEFRAEAK